MCPTGFNLFEGWATVVAPATLFVPPGIDNFRVPPRAIPTANLCHPVPPYTSSCSRFALKTVMRARFAHVAPGINLRFKPAELPL
jgi:hypothetical protein